MAIHSTTTKNTIRDGIATLSDFRAPATLSGTWEDGPLYMGRLSSEGQDRMREDTRDASRVYVVRSYETPIAWYVEGRGWSQTSDKFSVSTSNHQGQVAYAIGYATA